MRERKERKSKGSFSVLDEFTSDTGVGEIVYAPKANLEVLEKIERATRLADVPLSSRPPEDLIKTQLKEDSSQSETKLESTLDRSGPQIELNQPTIGLLLDHKWPTNQRQSRDKVETLLGTKWRQTEDKVETEQSQTRDKIRKSRDKVETQPETLLGTKWRQTEDKVETKPEFSSLVGLQRNLIIFLYGSCKAARSYETEKLSIEHIAKTCETSVSSAKKTLQRLEQKGFLRRSLFKDGRGGWTVYELKNDVFQDLLRAETEDKLGTKWRQTEDKVGTQLETQPRTMPPYSSSNNLNINTNTISAEVLSIPENLRRFGISAVNLQNLISSGKTTLEVAERSLAALSFDVENGKTGNLVNILFGVLGSGREYISQKYSESLQKELDQELSRIEQAEKTQKELSEKRLQMRFKEYLAENPGFLENIRIKHGAFAPNQEILEKVAFEEFRTREAQ